MCRGRRIASRGRVLAAAAAAAVGRGEGRGEGRRWRESGRSRGCWRRRSCKLVAGLRGARRIREVVGKACCSLLRRASRWMRWGAS